jgi:hypothetical protein
VAVADKLHRWTRALMLTSNAADLPDVLVQELLEQFLIPQGAIRVWGADEAFASLSFAQRVSDDLRSFATSLVTPYCGVNVGFMEVVARHPNRLRVFERGAGETLACGTGACAAVVTGIRLGLLDTRVDVEARGGTLTIEWAGGAAPVLMTGPATTVFEGEIEL